jgi:serine/threonine protein kinase
VTEPAEDVPPRREPAAEVAVKDPHGTHVVTVLTSDTVDGVKAKVQARTGIDASQQRIVFAGKQLLGEWSVGDIDIQREERNWLVLVTNSSPVSREAWDTLDLMAIRERAERLQTSLATLGGEVSLADFTVEGMLGKGANAFAYLARCRPDGQLGAHVDMLVVLKVVLHLKQVGAPADLLAVTEAQFRKTVEDETRGPGIPEFRSNIVHVLGQFDDDVSGLPDYATNVDSEFTDPNTAIIVLPFFSGGDLESMIQQGQLSEPAILDILAQVVDAVVKLQKPTTLSPTGLAHRDLKPDNIFFAGGKKELALADFGEVGPLQLPFIKNTTSPGGAQEYIAPEILARIAGMSDGAEETIGYAKNDVYAIGMIAYRMCLGSMLVSPWPPGIPPQALDMSVLKRIPPGVYSEGLRAFVEGLLSPGADQRMTALEAQTRSTMLRFGGAMPQDRALLAEPEPEPESPIAEAIARAAPPAGAIPALAIQTKMGNTLDCHTSLIAPALRLLQQEARGADWRANLGPYFEQSLAQHTATGAAGPSHNNDGRVGLRVWNLTDHRLRIRFCLEDGVENADAREIPPSSVESPIGPPDVPNWAFGTLTDAGQIVKISAKGAPEVEYLVCAEPSQHVFVVSHYELPALTFDRVGAASYAIQGGGAETSTDGDPRDCLAMSAGHVMATGRHSAVFTIVRTGPVTVYLGVAKETADVNKAWAWDSADFWALKHDREGCVIHRNRQSDWQGQVGFNAGDKIQLLLDMDEGSLAVKKNGVRLGTALSPGSLAGERLCWAVAHREGSAVRIESAAAAGFSHGRNMVVDDGGAVDRTPFVEPEPEPLPALPPSAVAGCTLATSNFRAAYAKAKAPADLMKLGAKLGDLIKAYCGAHGIPYDDDEGEEFFDQLRADMSGDESVPQAVQRMWTSYRQLRGREFCAILNEAVRDDDPARVKPAAALTRAINELCVTPGGQQPQPPFPPEFRCVRGGGFDNRYRDFFAPGREFRQPAFLATSFLESKADEFIRRSAMPVKAKWLIRIDPERKCRHVNLVTRRVPNLPDEQEYLFAPYSVFTVLSARWGAGTDADPHVIELAAAQDNKGPSEDLPLAPWS